MLIRKKLEKMFCDGDRAFCCLNLSTGTLIVGGGNIITLGGLLVYESIRYYSFIKILQ